MTENHVLLFSGGIDSFVAYWYLQSEMKVSVLPVYFDLGAPYNAREIQVCKRLIPDIVVDRSLSIGDTQRGQNAFIPYRNLLLACLGRKYGNNIWIAGLRDDCVEDKNPDAFNCMNDCMNFISKPEDAVKLRSPFWNMTKEQVVEWWTKYCPTVGLDKNMILETISCYDAYEQTNYCGRCPSCLRKFFALRSNGYNLEFYNQELFDEYVKRAERRMYDHDRCESILAHKDYKCKKIYCLDIDGVLTVDTKGHNYRSRSANRKNIKQANDLHDAGHRIVLFTSRFGTQQDRIDTHDWLQMHGVKYDSILFGKPYYDFYVDDKNIELEK